MRGFEEGRIGFPGPNELASFMVGETRNNVANTSELSGSEFQLSTYKVSSLRALDVVLLSHDFHATLGRETCLLFINWPD